MNKDPYIPNIHVDKTVYARSFAITNFSTIREYVQQNQDVAGKIVEYVLMDSAWSGELKFPCKWNWRISGSMDYMECGIEIQTDVKLPPGMVACDVIQYGVPVYRKRFPIGGEHHIYNYNNNKQLIGGTFITFNDAMQFLEKGNLNMKVTIAVDVRKTPTTTNDALAHLTFCEKMFTESTSHDYTVVVKKEDESVVEIPVHRFIMEARSSVFKAMLNSGMKEINQLNLSNRWHVYSVQSFIKYLYTNRVRLDPDVLNDTYTQVVFTWDLWEMADMYDISELQTLCEENIRSLIADTNKLHEILYKAFELNATNVKKDVLVYMNNHMGADEILTWVKGDMFPRELQSEIIEFIVRVAY